MFSTIGYIICIPFAALLRLFYNLTGSYGVSLILFTLVIKLILDIVQQGVFSVDMERISTILFPLLPYIIQIWGTDIGL